MKILGNRVLLSRITEEKKEGFDAVKLQDSFLYKGKVVQVSGEVNTSTYSCPITEGDTVLFAKNLPYTEEVDVEGEKMKIVRIEDILAVL